MALGAREAPTAAVQVASAPYPPLLLGCWIVAVLFITALVSYSDRLVLSALVDPLRASLGLSDTSVSLLQGPAFTLVYVFASLGFGLLTDRVVRKYLLAAGSLIWCLATLECGLARDFWSLFAGRLAVGVGEATLIPTAVSLIADSFPPRNRGTAVGLFAMGSVIGGPMGIGLGGVLLAAARSGDFAALPLLGTLPPWRFVLVSLGLTGFIAPLLLLSFPEPARREGREESAFGAALGHFLAERRVLLPLYAGMALLAIGDYGIPAWAPTALERVFGWSSDNVGLAMLLIPAVAGVLGSVSGGWFSDLAARPRGTQARLIVSVSMGVPAVLGAVGFAMGHAEWLLAGLGSWVLFSTIASIGGIATLQELAPARFRGSAMSLLTFGNTLIGLGAGPPLIALTTEHVYGTAHAVSLATASVGVVAGTLACAAFALSRRALLRMNASARPTPARPAPAA